MLGWIVLIIVVLVVLYITVTYNRFITLKNRIENSWAQIDVQLKRRADLIPNLIKTVKGYVKHEKGVLTEVTKARTSMTKARTVEQKARSSNMMTDTLKTLFAVAENYPKLQANQNFMMLQEELSGTESKIAYARQFYNDSVLVFNNIVEKFPSKFIASVFNFSKKHFFEASTGERKVVKVEF